MIFQDPLSALHPYYTIGAQITEGYLVHNHASRREAHRKCMIDDFETRFVRLSMSHGNGLKRYTHSSHRAPLTCPSG